MIRQSVIHSSYQMIQYFALVVYRLPSPNGHAEIFQKYWKNRQRKVDIILPSISVMYLNEAASNHPMASKQIIINETKTENQSWTTGPSLT